MTAGAATLGTGAHTRSRRDIGLQSRTCPTLTRGGGNLLSPSWLCASLHTEDVRVTTILYSSCATPIRQEAWQHAAPAWLKVCVHGAYNVQGAEGPSEDGDRVPAPLCQRRPSWLRVQSGTMMISTFLPCFSTHDDAWTHHMDSCCYHSHVLPAVHGCFGSVSTHRNFYLAAYIYLPSSAAS